MKEYAADWEALKATDPEVAGAIANELDRERTCLRLIASENYASPAVLAAIGLGVTATWLLGRDHGNQSVRHPQTRQDPDGGHVMTRTFKALSALRRRPDEELDEEAAGAIEDQIGRAHV